MTFWEWLDRHEFMAFMAMCAGCYVLLGLVVSIGRRRDVTVRLEGSGVEVVRGSSDGDRPS